MTKFKFIIINAIFLIGCSSTKPNIVNQNLDSENILENISNDLEISYNYVPELNVVGSKSKTIIEKGTVMTEKLIDNINNKKDIVLSHILLSKVLIPKDELFFSINYKEKQPEFTFHNLTWKEEGKNYIINIESYNFIRNYWNKHR